MRSLFLLLIFVYGAVLGQSYPTKPVRLIVTYPPGGSSGPDVARLRREALRALGPAGDHRVQARRRGLDRHGLRRQAAERRLHLRGRQPRSGGGESAALPRCRTTSRRTSSRCRMISTGPNVLVVRNGVAFRVARRHYFVCQGRIPGKLNYGTSGPGSVSHLSSEMLKNITKVQAVEVPYKGGVLAVQDLLGGQIQYIFSDSLPAMAHIRAGQAARAVRRPARSAMSCFPSRLSARPTRRAWWRSTGGACSIPPGTPRPIVREAARRHGEGARRPRR